MLSELGSFGGGFVCLVAGAEAMVRGASRLALSLGVSSLVVGLTIVSFGTSAPELAVSIRAVTPGSTAVAVGNVLGSNILNVLLILGASAVLRPLVVHSQMIRQEVPIMIGASVLLLVLILDGSLGRWDGALLLTLLAGYTIFLIRQSRAETRETREEFAAAAASERGWDRHWSVQLTLIVAGLVLLTLGSRWLVLASVSFARSLGVSDLIIGLTVIALGTSLPEIATTILAALRNERDIAVGNVVGSNTFNILGCLGAASLVSHNGLPIATAVMNFDIWVMIAVAIACLPVFISGRKIGRGKGLLFLAYYVAYVAYMVMDARGHDVLPKYSSIMLGFVLPITVVTLVAMVVRHQSKRRTADRN
jgi:cation:H+ antiporter